MDFIQPFGTDCLRLMTKGKNEKQKLIDVLTLFQKVLGERINDFKLPSSSFELMKCEIKNH